MIWSWIFSAAPVAQSEGRRWLSFELLSEHVAVSAFHFLDKENDPELLRSLCERILAGQSVKMNEFHSQSALAL